MQFRLAYVSPESLVVGAGELVDQPKEIALHYIKGKFFVDLLVVLPLPQVPPGSHRRTHTQLFHISSTLFFQFKNLRSPMSHSSFEMDQISKVSSFCRKYWFFWILEFQRCPWYISKYFSYNRLWKILFIITQFGLWAKAKPNRIFIKKVKKRTELKLVCKLHFSLQFDRQKEKKTNLRKNGKRKRLTGERTWKAAERKVRGFFYFLFFETRGEGIWEDNICIHGLIQFGFDFLTPKWNRSALFGLPIITDRTKPQNWQNQFFCLVWIGFVGLVMHPYYYFLSKASLIIS